VEEQPLSFEGVVRAGRLLFGPGFAPNGNWRAELRGAFRRRALETHPDRAFALGRAPGDLAREFHAVADAYRILSACVTVPLPRQRPVSAHAARGRRPADATPRGPGPHRSDRPRHAAEARRTSPPATPGRDDAASSHRAAGDRWVGLPRRPLRLGEFLYYTGRVPWSELMEAVAWQRRQRPAFGRIGVEFGFLAERDVVEILRRRGHDGAFGVPFGEYAVQNGFLTPFQLLAILGRQHGLQRPIGEYFVERGLLDPDEIEGVRRHVFFHNARCR
jgi:hypothetical protein